MRTVLLCVALMTLRCCLTVARSELVFRVPDVRVRHEAGSSDSKVLKGYVYQSTPLKTIQVEEYFLEHNISACQAKEAAKKLNINQVPKSAIGCGECSRKDLQYCEKQILSDHCCCERGYVEPFPWLPHNCYMGRRKCLLFATDCAEYSRIRVCCCLRPLAEKWKAALSTSPAKLPASYALSAVLTLNFLLKLFL